MAAIQDKSKDTVSVKQGTTATFVRAKLSHGSAKESIPIHVDGSKEEVSSADPTQTLADLEELLLSEKSIADRRQGPATAGGCGDGGVVSGKVHSASRMDLELSRARPIKPHETEPFLTVGTGTAVRSSSGLSTHDDEHLRPGSRRSRLLSATSRTSNRSLAGSRPVSADLRLSSSLNSHGNFASPFTGRSNMQSQGHKLASRMYVSPNSVTPRSNHHIKMPFKHSVHRPSETCIQEPSYDLKEMTALATYHVNRVLSCEITSEDKKQKGKLVKGKLKPLYPVSITGPSIKSCRGILSDTRSYTPSPSRTLQRRRHLVSQLRSGELEQGVADPLVTEGSESVHRVSAASSLDNLATMKDQMRAEQLLFNEDVDDEVPTKIADMKSMQEFEVDSNGKDKAQDVLHCGDTSYGAGDTSDGAGVTSDGAGVTSDGADAMKTHSSVEQKPSQKERSEYTAPAPLDTDCQSQGRESHPQTRRSHSAIISYSEPCLALRQENARPKTAQMVKSVRFADHSEEAARTQPRYEGEAQKDRMNKRLDAKDGDTEEEHDKKRRKDNQGCKKEEDNFGARKDDDENDDRDGGTGGGGGGRQSAAGCGNSSGSNQSHNSSYLEDTDHSISQSQGQGNTTSSTSNLTPCTERMTSHAAVKRKFTSDCEHDYCPSAKKEELASNGKEQQIVEESDDHSWSASDISCWATLSTNNNALSDSKDQAGGDGEKVVDDLKLLLAPVPTFSQKTATDVDGKCSVTPKPHDSSKLLKKTDASMEKNLSSISSADEILSNSCKKASKFHSKSLDVCWVKRESQKTISDMLTDHATGSCSLSTELNQHAAGLDGDTKNALKHRQCLAWAESCDSFVNAKTDLVDRPTGKEEPDNHMSIKRQSSKTSSSWSSSKSSLANDLQDSGCGEVEKKLSISSMPKSLAWPAKDLGRPPDGTVLDHSHLLELLLQVSPKGSPNHSLGSVTSIFESCDDSGSDEEAVLDSSEEEHPQQKGSSVLARRPKTAEHGHANHSLKVKKGTEVRKTVSSALPVHHFPQGRNSTGHHRPKQTEERTRPLVTMIHDTDNPKVRVHVCRHGKTTQGKRRSKDCERPKEERDSEQTNQRKSSMAVSHPKPCVDSGTPSDPILDLVRSLEGTAIKDHLGNVLIDEKGNVLMDVHGNSVTEVMTHFSMNEGTQEKTKHSVKKKLVITNELVSKVNKHGQLITGILKKKGPSSVFMQPRLTSPSVRGGNNNSQAEARSYPAPSTGHKKMGSIDQEIAAAVKRSTPATRPHAPDSADGRSEKTCAPEKHDSKGRVRMPSAKIPFSARNKISRANFQWMPVNTSMPSTSRKHKDGKTDYRHETVHSGKKQVFIATSREPFVFGSDDVVGRALAMHLKFGNSPYLKDMIIPKAEKGKRNERPSAKQSKEHLDSGKTLSDQSHSDSQSSYERRVKFPYKPKMASHNVNHNCCKVPDAEGCGDSHSGKGSDNDEVSSENEPTFTAVRVQQLDASTDVDFYSDSMVRKVDCILQSQDAASEENRTAKFDSLDQELAAVRSEIKHSLWDRKAQRLMDEVEAATALCNQDYNDDDGYVYEDNESVDDESQEEYNQESPEQEGREKSGNASDACVSFYRTVLLEYRNKCMVAKEGSLVLSDKLTWPSLLSSPESMAKAQGRRSNSSGAKTTQTGLRSMAASKTRPVSAKDSFRNRLFGKSTRVRPHSASVQGRDLKSKSLHRLSSSSVQSRNQTAVSSSQKGWTRSSSHGSLTRDPAAQPLETSQKRSGSLESLSQKQPDRDMKAGHHSTVDQQHPDRDMKTGYHSTVDQQQPDRDMKAGHHSTVDQQHPDRDMKTGYHSTVDQQQPDRDMKTGYHSTVDQQQPDRDIKAGYHSTVDDLHNSRPCSTADSGWESEGMSEHINSDSTQVLKRQSSMQSLEGRRLSYSSASEADSGVGWRLSSSTASEADRVPVVKSGNDVTSVYKVNRSGTHKVQHRPSSEQEEDQMLEVIAHSVRHDRDKPAMLDGPPASFPPLCFKITSTPPPGYLFFFAYSTYMNPDRLGLLVMRKMAKRFWAVLFGFRLAFNKRAASERTSGLANIVFNPFESVEGCIFLLSPAELDRLDNFSDCPLHYSRVVLPVWMSERDEMSDCADLANHCVPAVTYIAHDEWTIQESCVPNEFVAAQCCKSASGMLSTNYCARLKSLFEAAASNTPIPLIT